MLLILLLHTHMQAKENERKWKNVPVWKRAVLEKREEQRLVITNGFLLIYG